MKEQKKRQYENETLNAATIKFVHSCLWTKIVNNKNALWVVYGLGG